MKINVSKILKILSRLVVAAPSIIAAVKPIVREVKGGRGKPPPSAEPRTSAPIGTFPPPTDVGGSPPAA